MTLERANPLPAGNYWQDVFASYWPGFTQWLQAHQDTVRVTGYETTETNDLLDQDGDEARRWYAFSVSAPTQWDGPGYPTINDSGAKTSDQTVTKPSVTFYGEVVGPGQKSTLEQIEDSVTSGGKYALIALGFIAVIAIASKR